MFDAVLSDGSLPCERLAPTIAATSISSQDELWRWSASSIRSQRRIASLSPCLIIVRYLFVISSFGGAAISLMMRQPGGRDVSSCIASTRSSIPTMSCNKPTLRWRASKSVSTRMFRTRD